MSIVINLSDIETLKIDLRNGNAIRICEYVSGLLDDPVALASDPNLNKLFEAFDFWDEQLASTNLDLAKLYVIPQRVLIAIADTPEGFKALKRNPKLTDIILHFDAMRDAVADPAINTDPMDYLGLEIKLMDLAQSAS